LVVPFSRLVDREMLTAWLQYSRWTAIVVLSISLELFMIIVTLRMLFMLQKHWTGKLKAIVVFALRLPLVQVITKTPT
jgi:hypothetical protein